ncbi:hypothetical protein ACROYT_G028943 [Oculina patagonica]
MVSAGQEEPKDVWSLKRYQSIKSSEENVRMPKEGIIKIFSKLIMKRTGHLVPVGSGRNRRLTRFLSELMQIVLNGDVIATLVPNWEEHDFVAEFAERVGDSTL